MAEGPNEPPITGIENIDATSDFWEVCRNYVKRTYGHAAEAPGGVFSRAQMEILHELMKPDDCTLEDAIQMALYMEHVNAPAAAEQAADDGTPTVVGAGTVLPERWSAVRIDGPSRRIVYFNLETGETSMVHPADIDGPTIDARGNDLSALAESYLRLALPDNSYMKAILDMDILYQSLW
jgi:hypothetical protein